MIRIEKISSQVKTPSRVTPEAAGLDIYAFIPNEIICIPRGKYAIIPTGLKMELPVGTYGRIASRSGLCAQHGLHVGAGVIDSDYRGEVKVILTNLGNEIFEVIDGMKIAQLIVEKIMIPTVDIVTDLSTLSIQNETEDCKPRFSERGNKGFGSSGI